MRKVFADLVAYIKLHDGKRKPKINFQELYSRFPQFTFAPRENYGSYTQFGAANMIVSDGVYVGILKYQEYPNENLACITDIKEVLK